MLSAEVKEGQPSRRAGGCSQEPVLASGCWGRVKRRGPGGCASLVSRSPGIPGQDVHEVEMEGLLSCPSQKPGKLGPG